MNDTINPPRPTREDVQAALAAIWNLARAAADIVCTTDVDPEEAAKAYAAMQAAQAALEKGTAS